MRLFVFIPGYQADVLSDQPDSASTDNFPVEDGDVILVATDGVFDNLPQNILMKELVKVQGERCASRLQTVANSIAWMARSLAFDENFMSPFAKNAAANGIDTIGEFYQFLKRRYMFCNNLLQTAKPMPLPESLISKF